MDKQMIVFEGTTVAKDAASTECSGSDCVMDYTNEFTTYEVSRQRTRSYQPTIYIGQIPDGLRSFVTNIKDVKADGNCGFRAIADLLGFGEEDWLRIRKDLLNELQCHSEHYRAIFAVEGRYEEIEHALSYFDNAPPFDRWMTMPDMGHIIASRYNVVLYHLSLQQCLTFLPLRSVPLPPLTRKDIAVAFVNGNHFVEVFLRPGHPVPPIASNWHRHHLPCASGWATSYESRIHLFKQTISSDVIISETIEL